VQLRWVKFTGNGKLVQYHAEQGGRGELSLAPSSRAATTGVLTLEVHVATK
jgi:hypothetical protein